MQRMVLHPARRLAPSHGVHDHSPALIGLFSDWLSHVSCAGGRKILRIHRLDCRDLFSDSGFACSAGVCDTAVSHFDACSGFSAPLGPAQKDRALDDPDLAVRLHHRRSRLHDALQMVSSPERDAGNPACKVGDKTNLFTSVTANRVVCVTTQVLRNTTI
jgi:hypothetical protein